MKKIIDEVCGIRGMISEARMKLVLLANRQRSECCDTEEILTACDRIQEDLDTYRSKLQHLYKELHGAISDV